MLVFAMVTGVRMAVREGSIDVDILRRCDVTDTSSGVVLRCGWIAFAKITLRDLAPVLHTWLASVSCYFSTLLSLTCAATKGR